ncbi:flavodoxin [Ancylomarina sp. DW003]|nr:flavodoxin [Ancylomarina sp. DW003]MDE5421158.1 flavodoxin [Ancylomarina sp. DW003]
MQKIGIFYGSTTGNTETSAQRIQQEFGEDIAQLFDVSEATSKDIEQFTNLVFGASTWGIGDLQDDFESFMAEISEANLLGKKVAIFGLGDQYAYSDSFVDAIAEIYKNLKEKGCDLVGSTTTQGYEYDETQAEIDGRLVGLALDEENQSSLSETRIKNWVNELKGQFD